MATKSFIKEFAINRRNAGCAIKALNNPKEITLRANQRVEEVKKDQIKKIFKLED